MGALLQNTIFGRMKVAPLDFVSNWNTETISSGSSPVKTLKLPLIATGTYNFSVDWGDGSALDTITTYNQAQVTHTYAVAGIKTIRIKGLCTGWQFNNTGDKLKIRSIDSWGQLCLGFNEGFYFRGCSNLDLTAVSDVLDLTNTTSLASAFQACTALTYINNVEKWNTSLVTSLFSTFNSCTLFNQSLNGWNTINVTTLANTFFNCITFNADISLWNTSNVTTLLSTFSGCSTYNQPVNSWNTIKVTTLNNTFLNCYNFNQPVNSWNTASVTNMATTFANCNIFNQPLNLWNTSKVTTTSAMFAGCTIFDQNLGSFVLTACVNLGQMFSQAREFNNGGSTSINNWSFGPTVIYSPGIFVNAVKFNQPVGNWNTINFRDCTNMFSNAAAFNQPIGTWNMSNVTDIKSMLSGSTAFDQDIGTWDVSNVTAAGSFMDTKTAATFSATNLVAIYSGWSVRTLKPGVGISFGTAKYISAGSAGRALIISKGWTIVDGGIL